MNKNEELKINEDDTEVEFVDEEELEEEIKNPKSKPLTKKEEELINEVMDIEEERSDDMKLSAVDMLVKFKNFIRSDNFDKQADKVSRKYNIKKAAVKNKFIRSFLGTMADILNLTVSITGDLILGAVHFINSIIRNIVNFASSTLHKIINLLTLNCGTVVL